MANKEGKFYFDNFRDCMAIALEAAQKLKIILETYEPEQLPETLKAMHEIEHRGDTQKHEMIEKLMKAFITPIERNDIYKLSHTIDNLTDNIEEIVIKLYITSPQKIRAEAYEFIAVLIGCCQATYEMLGEFVNFKKSKILKEKIIEINHLEEEGDALYIRVMHDLYAKKDDVLEVTIWSQIYDLFEDCCDACENIANIVEGIVIDNM